MQVLIDSKLLDGLHSGEESVYTDVFHQLQPALVSYAMQYIIDRDLSKEIVQEAFLKLWEKRKTLSKGTNLTAYLYKIVRNLSLNYLRHIKIRDEFAKSESQFISEAALNYVALKDKSAERLLEAEIMERLQKAVNKMPPKCRNIFSLSRFDGKTYKEIAQELNITEKTVENQINKALKITRAEMQEFLPVTLLMYSFLCL
ncbi:MAG: RNA polymerase sigma-70 factor [Marinilabiliaceae bacterium]|nr:RNA polymerase sigma-70 factor [Marinilabiliaceae bacterium]